jgi:hypothetical protein
MVEYFSAEKGARVELFSNILGQKNIRPWPLYWYALFAPIA